ncbi:MAG: hypothetical protein ACRDHM_06575 [Actinomycetota bacterium]
MAISSKRRNDPSDGFHGGLLDSLSERAELSRRMQLVKVGDRELLFLWYVRQLPVSEVASATRISRRQCFRRRAQAIRTIVRLGEQTAS